MIIKDVAVSFPSRKVHNEEVLDLIRFYSKAYDGEIDKALRIISSLLYRSGLVSRNWSARGEKPIDHVAMAVRNAMSRSHLQPENIDLLVYVGIGGGFREPGNSYMIAKALGFRNAECFDVIDACMSWTRALSLVDSLFKAGSHHSAMVVNAEFNMDDGGPLFPVNFDLQSQEQIEYVLPSYTIGEAATATLLLDEEPENFSFTFHSRPDLADLCSIPTQAYKGYCQQSDQVGKLGAGRFTAFGSELHEHLDSELPKVLAKANIDMESIDVVVPHASAQSAWQKVGEKLGVADRMHHIYQDSGNVVSASIPAGLASAKKAGRLERGSRVACLLGSAGMSFAVSNFRF